MKKPIFHCFKEPSSLSKRLLVTIILWSSILTVFVTFFQLFYDYRKDIQDIEDMFMQIEQAYEGTLSMAMWHLNFELIQQIHSGLTSLPNIDYVKISYFEGWSIGDEPPEASNLLVHKIDISYLHSGTVNHLGQITMASNIDRIYYVLAEKLGIILLTQAGKTFLVAIFMLIIFESLIMRHLRMIAAFARKIQLKGHKESAADGLVLDSITSANSELSDVVHALNEMRDNITKSYLELELARQKLQELNLSLEEDVKRRIHENEQQQVLLEYSARLSSLGEMAGNIAHEINNPLAIISGYINIIHSHLSNGNISSEKLEHMIQRIDITIRRITDIISGLLRLSRQDFDKPMVESSLNQVIVDALAICNEKFSSQGIRLIQEIPGENLSVICQSIEIGQIMLNLLNNAFDAVKNEPDPWIKVELIKQYPMVTITVSNNGPIVPVEIRSRIMEPFFTTKPYGHGTGLGLCISRALAEKHKGKLYLDEHASYTRFVVELPLAIEQDPETDAKQVSNMKLL
ncbi:MAG: ATP-binding protein [Oligoflexus sp.]